MADARKHLVNLESKRQDEQAAELAATTLSQIFDSNVRIWLQESTKIVKDEIGELVWQGSVEIANEQNKEVVTSIPLQEALPTRKPGIYVMTAVSPTSANENWDSRATQWFVVSDIGLSTFAGTDGLHVFARSLASASPLANIELQLIAKNNEILATATTDSEGRARFDAGLVRGGAALAPAVIAAHAVGLGAGDGRHVVTRVLEDLQGRLPLEDLVLLGSL